MSIGAGGVEEMAWVGRALGGRVLAAERQSDRPHGGRPAWFVDVERDDGPLRVYARLQRPELRDGGAALEREGAVLDALGNPQDTLKIVHVAGTNGKGSTCAMIERSLRIAGVRTGLFVSPHLIEPTERIRVAGAAVTAGEFAAAFDLVHAAAERLITAGEIDMHPTYFETITAMALALFREKGAAMVVLETGMGGRLDATNVVDPLLSVITPIDFDHEKYLGNSIPEIAYEKAGILKPGRPAVFARQRPEALEVLERRARETGSTVTRVTDWGVRDLEIGVRGNRFTAVHGAAEIEVHCPLIGAHQVDNAMTAVVALHALGVPRAAIEAGSHRGKGRRRDADGEGECGDKLGGDRNIDAEPVCQCRQHPRNDQGADPVRLIDFHRYGDHPLVDRAAQGLAVNRRPRTQQLPGGEYHTGLDRDAGIHQGQCRSTDGSHR